MRSIPKVSATSLDALMEGSFDGVVLRHAGLGSMIVGWWIGVVGWIDFMARICFLVPIVIVAGSVEQRS